MTWGFVVCLNDQCSLGSEHMPFNVWLIHRHCLGVLAHWDCKCIMIHFIVDLRHALCLEREDSFIAAEKNKQRLWHKDGIISVCCTEYVHLHYHLIVLCHKKTSGLMDKRWQLQPSMHQNVFLPLCVCVLIDKGPGIDVFLDGWHFNSRIVSSWEGKKGFCFHR